MNLSNFDELTKRLANSTSRRDALKIITRASLFGLFGLGSISTAFGKGKPCARIGHRCKTNNDCCNQFCANGKCACPAANVCGSNCLAAPCDANQCQTCNPGSGNCVGCSSGHTCVSGSCCGNSGTTCSVDGDCCSGTCCQGVCCGAGQTCLS